MKNMINKLRSQTGASITFALLLFLVCGVLCSVILTAATAASGRMSQIAETDQRYYAVTSAAELLKELIDGKTVSIAEVEETTYKTSYTDGVAGAPTKEDSDSKTYIVPDKKVGEIDEASDYVDKNLVVPGYESDTIQKDAALNIYSETVLESRILEVTSNLFSDAGLDFDALAVTIEENLDEEGNITLTIYNKYRKKDTESKAGERYTLVLLFGADKSETSNSKTENVSSTAENDNTYIVKTKTTEIKVTTVTWNLTGMTINPEGSGEG